MALIEYPSLMPLYICSVSLETHKASFSGSCDESSSRCWPCKFGRNKRAIEQSVEFRRYRKRGGRKERAALVNKELYSCVCRARFTPSSPVSVRV